MITVTNYVPNFCAACGRPAPTNKDGTRMKDDLYKDGEASVCECGNSTLFVGLEAVESVLERELPMD